LKLWDRCTSLLRNANKWFTARWIRWKSADADCESNRFRLLCNCSWFSHDTLEYFSSLIFQCTEIQTCRLWTWYMYIMRFCASVMYLIACFDFSQDFIKNWNYVWINTYDAKIVVTLLVLTGNYKQTQTHFSRWCIR